jgi:hypothetical protein
MGQRLNYYISKEGKTLQQLITDHYTDFRTWSIKQENNSQNEFNEAYLASFFHSFLMDNPNSIAIDSLDQMYVDAVVSNFFGDFTGWSDTKGYALVENLDPCVYTMNYINSKPLIERTKDKNLAALWHFFIEGRSLKNDFLFKSVDEYNFKVGYLKVEEQALMLKLMRKYFGNINTIRKNHWSARDLKNLAEGGSFFMQGNPISSGIECVLQVLEHIKDKKTELIMGIE